MVTVTAQIFLRQNILLKIAQIFLRHSILRKTLRIFLIHRTVTRPLIFIHRKISQIFLVRRTSLPPRVTMHFLQPRIRWAARPTIATLIRSAPGAGIASLQRLPGNAGKLMHLLIRTFLLPRWATLHLGRKLAPIPQHPAIPGAVQSQELVDRIAMIRGRSLLGILLRQRGGKPRLPSAPGSPSRQGTTSPRMGRSLGRGRNSSIWHLKATSEAPCGTPRAFLQDAPKNTREDGKRCSTF